MDGVAEDIGGAFLALGSLGHGGSMARLWNSRAGTMKYVSAIGMFLAVTLAMSSSALAWGALAVGIPRDVAKDGYSSGAVVDETTEDVARDHALNVCRGIGVSPGDVSGTQSPTAQSRCTLVKTFQHQCYAIADDPQNGTPGVGWGVAPTQEEADAQALENCRATAGEGRQAYCAIGDTRGCDNV